MKFTPMEIPDVILIEPDVYEDERGYFFESFRKDLFEQNVGKIDFVQDNESKSSYGVLRGLHYQIPPFEQSKLVRVISGEILDVDLSSWNDIQIMNSMHSYQSNHKINHKFLRSIF